MQIHAYLNKGRHLVCVDSETVSPSSRFCRSNPTQPLAITKRSHLGLHTAMPAAKLPLPREREPALLISLAVPRRHGHRPTKNKSFKTMTPAVLSPFARRNSTPPSQRSPYQNHRMCRTTIALVICGARSPRDTTGGWPWTLATALPSHRGVGNGGRTTRAAAMRAGRYAADCVRCKAREVKIC